MGHAKPRLQFTRALFGVLLVVLLATVSGTALAQREDGSATEFDSGAVSECSQTSPSPEEPSPLWTATLPNRTGTLHRRVLHTFGVSLLAGAYVWELGVSAFAGALASPSCLALCFPNPTEPAQAWVPFRTLGLVPVVGPWIQLGLVGELATADSVPMWHAMLATTGALQTLGLALLIVGALVDVGPAGEGLVWVSPDVGVEFTGVRLGGALPWM